MQSTWRQITYGGRGLGGCAIVRGVKTRSGAGVQVQNREGLNGLNEFALLDAWYII